MCPLPVMLKLALLQISSAYYKSVQGNEEGRKELKKQVAAFDKYLKEIKKFIGGGLLKLARKNQRGNPWAASTQFHLSLVEELLRTNTIRI